MRARTPQRRVFGGRRAVRVPDRRAPVQRLGRRGHTGGDGGPGPRPAREFRPARERRRAGQEGDRPRPRERSSARQLGARLPARCCRSRLQQGARGHRRAVVAARRRGRRDARPSQAVPHAVDGGQRTPAACSPCRRRCSGVGADPPLRRPRLRSGRGHRAHQPAASARGVPAAAAGRGRGANPGTRDRGESDGRGPHRRCPRTRAQSAGTRRGASRFGSCLEPPRCGRWPTPGSSRAPRSPSAAKAARSRWKDGKKDLSQPW